MSNEVILFDCLSNKLQEAVNYVLKGNRLSQPKSCPETIYKIMLSCWEEDPAKRPTFADIYHQLQALSGTKQSNTLANPGGPVEFYN